MDDEIQFGEMKQKGPESMLPPDRDSHYATVLIGDCPEGDLPVYIDLDVFNELENHAVENVNVELGGVLLGRQAIDDQGRSLVVICDSLRAEHYEATRGSFKFTHSTWSEITRRRARMNDSMRIVGWYHTHPGWGIFLSDMDDFICRNFFNGPLDVALVIDPRQGTRGWFQWTADQRETRQCNGFFLITSRHREMELRAIANQLTSFEQLSPEPFFAEGNPAMYRPTPSQPAQRLNQIGLFLVVWLVGFQTLVLALVAWKVLSTSEGAKPAVAASPEATNSVRLESERRIYRELAQFQAAQSGSPTGLVDRLAAAQLELEKESTANQSHLGRIRSLENDLANSQTAVANHRFQNEQLEALLQQEKGKSEQAIAGIGAAGTGNDLTTGENGFLKNLAIGVLAVLAGVLAAALWIVSRRHPEFGTLAMRGSGQNDFELRRPGTGSPEDSEISQTDSKNFEEFRSGTQPVPPSAE